MYIYIYIYVNKYIIHFIPPAFIYIHIYIYIYIYTYCTPAAGVLASLGV